MLVGCSAIGLDRMRRALVVQGPGTQATNRIPRSEVRQEALRDLRPVAAPVISVVFAREQVRLHMGVSPAPRQGRTAAGQPAKQLKTSRHHASR